MTLGAERRRLLEMALSGREDRSDFQRKLESELTNQAERRAAIASQFRKQLIDRSFAAAGIDQTEILNRPKAESVSLRRDVYRLRPALDAGIGLDSSSPGR